MDSYSLVLQLSMVSELTMNFCATEVFVNFNDNWMTRRLICVINSYATQRHIMNFFAGFGSKPPPEFQCTIVSSTNHLKITWPKSTISHDVLQKVCLKRLQADSHTSRRYFEMQSPSSEREMKLSTSKRNRLSSRKEPPIQWI